MADPSWVAINKGYAATFKNIRREYSEIEAIFSLSLDINCDKERSLRSYSRMWSWSIGKVKRFILKVKTNGTPTEHQRNTNGTDISLILLNNQDTTEHKRNTNGTPTEHEYKEQEQEQETTTTISPKKRKVKKEFSYSDSFEKFWTEYPKKKGKFKAFSHWEKYDCGNGMFEQIMSSLEKHKTCEQWTKDDGKYIPHGSTWINNRGWEDDADFSSESQKISEWY